MLLLIQVALFHSFWQLSSIPLYICTTSSLSINGHLGYFHVLAVVNSAAMNTGVPVSFWIVLSGYMPRSGIGGSHGNSIFSFFKELLYCFPWWLYQFIFPPTMEESSLFSTLVCVFNLHFILWDLQAHSMVEELV